MKYFTARIFALLFLLISPMVANAQEADTLSNNESVGLIDSLSPKSAGKAWIADEVIAIVGNSSILYSDLDRTAKSFAALRKERGTLSKRSVEEEALEALLKQKFMASCAELDSLDKDMRPVDADVEMNVDAMVKSAGSVKKLEEMTGKAIFQIKADMTIEMKQMELAKMMEQKIRSEVDIDYAEVREYYDTVTVKEALKIPLKYSYSQIVKQPEQTEERKYAIREKLLGYRKRILDGEVSLGVLAQLYSMDPGSARRRGEMGPMSINQFVKPFAEAARNLSVGEVSGIVETEYGFHLLELVSKTGEGNEMMVTVRHILLKPEFTVEESQAAASQLDSVKKEVVAGNITFADAALKFSDDRETNQNGGRAFNQMGYKMSGDIRAASTEFAAEDLMPEDYRNLSVLKIGDISSPFETTDMKGNNIQKIVKLDKILEAHNANIVDDYDMIEARAQNAKQLTVIDDYIDANLERVYIEIDSDFWDYDFEREGWVEAAKRTVNNGNLNVDVPTLEDIENAIEIYKFKEEARKVLEQNAENQKGKKKNK